MGGFLGKSVYLPAMGAEDDTVTVSGISGGGFTAIQMHTIYSGTIKGSGLIASRSYGVEPWDTEQTNTGTESINRANKYWDEELIDDPANLNGDPVYIYGGGKDTSVPTNM